MKTIKKSGKDYIKNKEVDWARIVGKKCVVKESSIYIEIDIQDYDPESQLLCYKSTEMSSYTWVDSGIHKWWSLIFVFEPCAVLSDEMKLLLDNYTKKPITPIIPPTPITIPSPVYKNECSVCGLNFEGPLGYVCYNTRCPSGLNLPQCSLQKVFTEYDTGNIQ